MIQYDKIEEMRNLKYQNQLPDCPNCGEEGYENWIFAREGNFDEEYK